MWDISLGGILIHIDCIFPRDHDMLRKYIDAFYVPVENITVFFFLSKKGNTHAVNIVCVRSLAMKYQHYVSI
jgi:hypothetical protein